MNPYFKLLSIKGRVLAEDTLLLTTPGVYVAEGNPVNILARGKPLVIAVYGVFTTPHYIDPGFSEKMMVGDTLTITVTLKNNSELPRILIEKLLPRGTYCGQDL
jgi:hypothetical protein